jgi:hypothetical protein
MPDRSSITRRTLLQSALFLPTLRRSSSLLAGSVTGGVVSAAADVLTAVPFTSVEVHDEFWAPRMEVNRRVSIWHCFERMRGNEPFGVSKLIEAAAYMLALRRDAELETYVDGRIDAMVAALKPRLADPDLAVRVPGHFLEAAVAYARATGKRAMLDAALTDTRIIDAAFGPGRKTYISEHEGQKIGLIALARDSGDERLWRLAAFLLEARGKPDYPRRGTYAADRTYAQDHAAVVDQREAVGHCVRATFLYIALTDLAAHTGDPRYARAADAIWQDVVFRKMYLTGGIGSIRFHEQFGAAYELPNLSAWGETCGVRAPEPERVGRDVRGLRQRGVEPAPVPAPRRGPLSRRHGARALQRVRRRRVPAGRPVLLPDAAQVLRRLRTVRVDQHALLSTERGAVDRIDWRLLLRAGAPGDLREPVRGQPRVDPAR